MFYELHLSSGVAVAAYKLSIPYKVLCVWFFSKLQMQTLGTVKNVGPTGNATCATCGTSGNAVESLENFEN